MATNTANATKTTRRGSRTPAAPVTPAPAPAPAPEVDPLVAALGFATPADSKKTKAPKADVNGAKHRMAAAIVVAAGEAIAKLSAADLAALGGKESALDLGSRWLHYLPLGGKWPTGKLPVPNRSEWRETAGE